MKTAQDIYYQTGCNTKRDIIGAMKQYATQVAKQALKDASDNLTDCHSSLSAWKSNKSEILDTPIYTP